MATIAKRICVSVLRRGLRITATASLAVLILLLLHPLAAAAPTAQADGWWADYFANRSLSGSPVLSRHEDDVDFDWGEGSPGSGVPADDFSARWTREAWFDDGTYRFTVRADDGLRLWVGEELIVDAWRDQQASPTVRDLYIGQGTYTVRVEYYEHGGGAIARVDWQRLLGSAGWLAEYFDNKKLEGAPVLERTDPAINFDWQWGSPGPAVPNDKFSVRWTRILSFPAGAYRFHTTADDGVRFWVDDHLLVDAWYDQSLPNDRWGDLVLDDQPHQVKVEYYEGSGGAQIYVWWERLDSFAGWKGEYYDNLRLDWPPVMTRDDATIDFDWGTAPPVAWMPDDNFSIRWQGEMTFAPGFYRIAVRADDGVRVWMDETRLMIDQWHAMDNELHYVDGTYLSGVHRFKVEYYEQNGHARIQFWVAATPWKAEYYANPDLAGEPKTIRLHEDLDFDWGNGAPLPDFPADDFSVRWTAEQDFQEAWYTFDVTADDGARLYLDGELALDDWQAGEESTSVTRYLHSGQHTVVLEYTERTGVARVKLDWRRAASAGRPAMEERTIPDSTSSRRSHPPRRRLARR